MALLVPWAANAQTPLFSEDFEDGSMPTGWTTDGPGTWTIGTGDYSASTGAGQGTYNAKITHGTTGNVTKLITPEIDLSSVTTAELSFMHVQRSWAGDIDQLRVYYRTSSSGTWTQILEYTAAFASWTTEEAVSLPNLSSTYQLAFEHTDKYGYGVGVDNIVIVQGAATPKPSGLAVSGVTDNSATLNWNENGTATSWQICVNDDETNLITTTTKPYEFTGLTAQTTYTVKVRSIGSPNSDWSNSLTFNTTAVAVAVGDSWSDDFEGASCGWELINGTCTNAWAWGTAASNGGTYGLYVSNDGGTTNAYTVSSAAMVYATKLLSFTEGKFEFSYDWMANGESTYDFLRVVLVPASVTLTAGTSLPSGLTYQAVPTDWIAVDGGSKLNLVTEWQNKTVAVNVPAGNYYLVMAWRDDTSGGTNPPAAVDNVSITKMACAYDVTNLEAGHITTTGATIAWEGGEATQWQVAYSTTSTFADATEVIVDESTYAITGLQSSTVYYVKVRAYCGGEDFGAWSSVLSFPTECDVIPAVGYAENFDSYTAGANVLPICWNYINTTTYSTYAAYPRVYANTSYSTYANTAPNCLYFYSYYSSYSDYDPQDQYAILPEMSDLAGKQITMQVRGYNTSSTFKIGTMSDPTDATTFTEIATQDGLTTSYQEFFYIIPAETTDAYLAIMIEAATESRTYNGIYVDDIVIAEAPSCIKPTGLAVNYEGGTSATFTWTENGTATSWDLQYSTDAEFTTYTQQQVDGTPTYELTGLELATTYYVRVNAFCGTPSDYSNIVSFTTDLCMPENQCELTFALTDSWGDGWNGAYIDVVDVATNISLGQLKNNNIAKASETETYTLSVCDGREIQFVWHVGSFDSECSYVVTDVNGEEIFSGSGAMSEPVNYTVNCTVTNCKRPTDLAASEIANHSAVLSWTENGEATEWVVEITDVVGGQNTEWNAGTNPFTLVGLAAETEYSVKVRPVCSDFDDKWSDAITFTTDVACPAPTNVAVSDVEPFAATVSWNGTAENYNLRYRAARGFNYGFETAEGFVVDEFPPCTTYDGDGLPTYGIDGYTMPNNTANYVGSVVSFNEYWAAHSGNVMGVFMDAIPDTEAGITANDDYFILPELTIAAGDHFTFWARSVTANYGLERMKVGVYAGNGTISSYFAGSATEYVEVPVEWTKYDYDLTDYVGQTIQLAINCVSADAFALLFDDLFVGDPIGTWDVTLNNVTSPYTLTGLTDETIYEVQVQAACGAEDGESEWVGATFTTPSNCAAPTNLAANDITPNAATLSWEGFHDSYNLQYRTAESRVTYYFTNFNTDADREGWTWTGSVIYGLSDPIYGFSGDDNHFLQMGWATTDEAYIISPELPAYESGAYVEFYYFGNTIENSFQVGYSTTTNDADAFTWSERINAPLATYTLYNEVLADGVKYVAFKATASEQGATIFIDNFGIFGETIPAGAWQTVTTASPYALSGLADKTEYEWQVQGINAGCDGGVTAWSHMATFTTLDACMTPVINGVGNIEATTATVSWTGVQDSYNVKYGAYETMAFINFDDGVIPTSFTNDTVYAWALTDALTDEGYCIKSSNEGVASSSSTISLTATFETAGMIVFDAMFMGEGTSTYYDKCIFSIDSIQQFSYGAIGEVWNTMGYNVAAGEHTFTWTYSKDGSVNPTGDFFALDNIMLITNNITWTTVEGVTGNSYNMTGLTPNSLIAVQVQGNNTICNDGVTDWSDAYLFITPGLTTVTQTIALAAGWNWISSNVEITLADLQNALVAAMPGTSGITIKSQSNTTTYNGTKWRGQLNTLDLARMYMVSVPADCEITLTGMAINPEEHPAAIGSGYTWIAFPLSTSMTLTDAFAGFAISGDQVKSQSDGTANYNGTKWRGTLTNLVPGNGYFYKSTESGRTLIFPSSAKAAAPKAGQTLNSIIEKELPTEKLIDYRSK
jgi:hypothetical protein